MKKFVLAALLLTGAATASNAQLEAGVLGLGVGTVGTITAAAVVIGTTVLIATGTTTTTTNTP